MVSSSRPSSTQPPMSLFNTPTICSFLDLATRTNSRAPSEPDSSPVRNANWTVAGCGCPTMTRAASSSAVVPVPSSSDPAVRSTESKWADITWMRSGYFVPLSVATTLAVRTPGRGSNHCTSGSYPQVLSTATKYATATWFPGLAMFRESMSIRALE